MCAGIKTAVQQRACLGLNARPAVDKHRAGMKGEFEIFLTQLQTDDMPVFCEPDGDAGRGDFMFYWIRVRRGGFIAADSFLG